MMDDKVYVDDDGFTDVLCKGQIDVSRFKDDMPKWEPCMNGEFTVQMATDGRVRIVCSVCGRTVEI